MPNFTDVLKAIDSRMREKLADPEHEARCARIEASIKQNREADTAFRRKTAGIPAAFVPFMDDPWGSLISAGRLKTEDRAALDFVDAWRKSGKPVGILAGDLGRGKSVAMCWAVDRDGGYYVEASDICRAGWYGDTYWDLWTQASVLALDELGMEPMDGAGWWEAKLHRLLAGRLNDGKRTLLGTNLDRAALQKRYGSDAMVRTWDRLSNAWEAKVFRGPSMRRVAT